MRKVAFGCLMIGVSAVGYKFLTTGGSMAVNDPAAAPVPPVGTYKVVMYSNSNCKPCNLRRSQFAADGIAHVEHFMDREPVRMQEMMDKLTRARLSTSGVHLPQLEINGVMMQANPSMQAIRTQLAKR